MSLPPYDARRITDADAEIIATHMADKLIARLTDKEVVNSIASVWASQLDQHIGRTVRRGVYTILIGLVVVVGIKMDAIISWFRAN